jgi:hypothetical protein
MSIYEVLLSLIFVGSVVKKEHYVRHGFHLNVKGKDLVAKMLVSAFNRHIQ